MDDMHVVIVYAKNKKMQIDLVAFTGYIPAVECIAIGAVSEIKRQIEAGEIPPPEGYDKISGDFNEE